MSASWVERYRGSRHFAAPLLLTLSHTHRDGEEIAALVIFLLAGALALTIFLVPSVRAKALLWWNALRSKAQRSAVQLHESLLPTQQTRSEAYQPLEGE